MTSTALRRLRLSLAACLALVATALIAVSTAEAHPVRTAHPKRPSAHFCIRGALREATRRRAPHARIDICGHHSWRTHTSPEPTDPSTDPTGTGDTGTTTTTTTPTSTTATPAPTQTTTTTSAPAPTQTTTTTPPSTGSTPTGAVQSDVAPGNGGSGWNGYGGQSLPGADWRPYADSSPFNQPIVNPTVVANSQAYVSDALQWGAPGNLATSANTTGDYSHPTYYAQPTDPTYTIQTTGGWTNQINGQTLQVPGYAAPADGGDHHLTIIEPNGSEFDFWDVTSMRNGVITAAAASEISVTGSGLGASGTAAHFGNLAGVIRAPELAAGNIDHALFIVLKCASDNTSFGYGTTDSQPGSPNGSFVYPASGGGSTCPSGTSSVPLGTRFWLDMTPTQIQNLAVPSYLKTILTAMATYGGYVGDTGGPGFGFEFESSMTYTQLGMPDPLRTLGQQLGLPTWQGQYVYNVANGVNWQQYLRVIAPPNQA